MKFVLIIWVCSFLGSNACLPPIEHPKVFNSWYECSRAAYKESGKLLSKMGYADVNQYRIATRYTCKSTYTY
jgi:hypothetical protein